MKISKAMTQQICRDVWAAMTQTYVDAEDPDCAAMDSIRACVDEGTRYFSAGDIRQGCLAVYQAAQIETAELESRYLSDYIRYVIGRGTASVKPTPPEPSMVSKPKEGGK